MKVGFDGEERTLRAGVSAASLLDEEQRKAAAAGELFVADAWGNRVGLEGTLTDGAAYFAVRAGARPPSVNACLEAFGVPGKPAFPADLAKFLVRRGIAAFRKAGGAASAEATAAFAAATAAREDAAALWEYVAGEGRAVRVYEEGAARVRDLFPDLQAAVIAARDVLTFRTGRTTFDYLDGVRVVEVGTTNKVKLTDYEAAFGGVDAVVSCEAGDFAVEGFVDAPAPGELAEAAAKAGLKFITVRADAPLLDESRKPRRFAGDVAIWATPPEARAFDFAFYPAALDTAAGDAALRNRAAAALWEYLTED